MADEIITNLVSPVSYTAGEGLQFKIAITAPAAGTYYVLGALYDSDYNYISGTLFGVLLPVGATIAYNSPVQASTLDLSEDEVQEVNCQFILNRSSVRLGLFLMELTGTEASWEFDTQVDSTTATLSGPAAMMDLSAMVNLMIAVGMMGLMAKMVISDKVGG